jgi:hypothetical protein
MGTFHSPAGYSGNHLSAELGVKPGTSAALISAPEHLPVLLEDVWMDIQYIAPEITDARALANHLRQGFDSNEVLWSCDGHHGLCGSGFC